MTEEVQTTQKRKRFKESTQTQLSRKPPKISTGGTQAMPIATLSLPEQVKS